MRIGSIVVRQSRVKSFFTF